MKAAAFLNLPMQPRGLRIVNLHAVDAEVVFLRDRVLGIDQRERDEWPTVFVPGCQCGQSVETPESINDFRYWPARYGFRAELEELSDQRSMLPEFSAIGRQQRLCDVY